MKNKTIYVDCITAINDLLHLGALSATSWSALTVHSNFRGQMYRSKQPHLLKWQIFRKVLESRGIKTKRQLRLYSDVLALIDNTRYSRQRYGVTK